MGPVLITGPAELLIGQNCRFPEPSDTVLGTPTLVLAKNSAIRWTKLCFVWVSLFFQLRLRALDNCPKLRITYTVVIKTPIKDVIVVDVASSEIEEGYLRLL